MSRSVIAVSGHGLVDRVNEHASLKRVSRVAGTLATTLAVLWIAKMGMQPKAARAGQDSPAAARRDGGGAAAVPSAFVTESRNELNNLRDQLSDLGDRLLAGIEPGVAADRDLASQSLFMESLKASLNASKLALDAAEMALKAYQDADFKNQKRECDAELELARSDVKRAAPKLAQAKEREARIPKTPQGSLMRLSRDWQFEAQVFGLRLEERKAQFEFEAARSKSKLLDFKKAVDTKKLESEVEKARSNVLTRQATYELEQSKLLKTQRQREGVVPLSPSQSRNLELLEAAIPIEEQWSAKLEQCAKTEAPSELLRKDVRDLAQRLAAILGLAREQEAENSLAELKRKLDR